MRIQLSSTRWSWSKKSRKLCYNFFFNLSLLLFFLPFWILSEFYPKKRFINFENFTQKISSIVHFTFRILNLIESFFNQMNRDTLKLQTSIFLKSIKKKKKIGRKERNRVFQLLKIRVCKNCINLKAPFYLRFYRTLK